jgi:hypothetical protein
MIHFDEHLLKVYEASILGSANARNISAPSILCRAPSGWLHFVVEDVID